MSELFVTGITGLVGRAVAADLSLRSVSVTALVRPGSPEPPEWAVLPEAADRLRVVEGDLERAADLGPSLVGVRSVLHIAALTGAASADEFRAVNVEGTRALLEASTSAGVERFVFVSSIAAGFEDLERYPYGASKREAEALVQASGLDWVIVRPTVVIAAGSPLLARFEQLAALPVSPLPGSGNPRIQPIAAEDLASCLLDLALGKDFSAEIIEIGGPGVVTLEALLRAVRTAKGRRANAIQRLPLAPIRAGLGLARLLTAGRFPISPAQLAMFAQDGVAEPHPFVQERRASFADLTAMLSRSLEP